MGRESPQGLPGSSDVLRKGCQGGTAQEETSRKKQVMISPPGEAVLCGSAARGEEGSSGKGWGAEGG
jgi:hypothetical protein